MYKNIIYERLSRKFQTGKVYCGLSGEWVLIASTLYKRTIVFSINVQAICFHTRIVVRSKYTYKVYSMLAQIVCTNIKYNKMSRPFKNKGEENFQSIKFKLHKMGK